MEQALFLKKDHHYLSGDLFFDFCGFSKNLPFHSFGPAIRQQYILHIVMDGTGTYHVKDQQYKLKKGDLFLIRPGDSTFYHADGEEPWLYCWISFGGKVADEVIRQSVFQENGYTMVSSTIQKYIDLIMDCMAFNEDSLSSELRLNEQLYRLFYLLINDGGTLTLGTQKGHSPLAIEVMSYIQQHYAEEITVEQIAKALAVNRSHLSRLFSTHIGMSIKEYLTGVRINRGAFLLSMTDKSIEAIAQEVGFNSLVVFSRTFKKVTGETARSYRKRMQQESASNLSMEKLRVLLERQQIVSRAT
ncbi:AraC family transcriptional regulator [Enterococcus florum]|uniref:AraC family transcriptional regulator n=1 Tax=Enterococcus florum TaxID=2480627 RepID=A0A4P5PH27_9ENTE|nr:AraC family ligand binding domain-containing protein [Enterococcus florum]GCF95628.1 AraC family transcriptional regulator [Enterococcus florum]